MMRASKKPSKISHHGNENYDNYADWRRKRRSTAWICIAYAFMIGMEYSCISTSLLYYLKDDLKLSYPKVWYSVIMSLINVSASINAVISGKLFDKTRMLKTFMLIFTSITLAGNLLYTVNASVWFLVLGRFLCGLCDASQPVISGEFSRLFEGTELTQKLSQYQAFYAFGFVTGPATPIIFGQINIRICSWWTWNQNNVGSVFMALVMLVMIPAIIFGVHDFSREDTQSTKKSPIDSNKQNENFNLNHILSNLDIMLLISSSSFTVANAGMVELMINLTASDWYKWSLTRLGVITCACVLIYTFFMLTLAHKLIGRHLRLMFLSCFFFQGLCIIILMLPKVTPIHNVYWQEVQISVCIITNTITGLTMSVLARALLFQMVPKAHASFADGFRSTIQRILGTITFFCAVWAYETSIYVSPLNAAILFLIALILMSRRAFHPAADSISKKEKQALLDEICEEY